MSHAAGGLPRLRRLLADGRAKLFMTYRTLNFRRGNRSVFSFGNYRPCPSAGDKAECVCAFTRGRCETTRGFG